jgi:hypothetical protein
MSISRLLGATMVAGALASTSGKPCPNMGSSKSSGSSSGSSYSGGPAGATAQ